MRTLSEYQNACDDLLLATTSEVRETLSRVKARDLYPVFLSKVIKTQEALIKDGYYFWVTTAGRTWEEQAALYAYGRTDMSKGIVTKAKAGASAHNYFVAVDGAYDTDLSKKGLQPSWGMEYMKLWADAGTEAGLDAGLFWKGFVDGPHLQLNLKQHGLTVGRHLLPEYNESGKIGVFQFLDTFDW